MDLCPARFTASQAAMVKPLTTTILAKMLAAAGKKVHLGGNIGRPLPPDIWQIGPDDVAVVELSSFQLISMRSSPDVAVVTNISPNHLDVHKDMQEYVEAKENILLHQNAFARAVLNLDNAYTAGFAMGCPRQLCGFSSLRRPERRAFCRTTVCWLWRMANRRFPCSGEKIKLPGVTILKTTWRRFVPCGEMWNRRPWRRSHAAYRCRASYGAGARASRCALV